MGEGDSPFGRRRTRAASSWPCSARSLSSRPPPARRPPPPTAAAAREEEKAVAEEMEEAAAAAEEERPSVVTTVSRVWRTKRRLRCSGIWA